MKAFKKFIAGVLAGLCLSALPLGVGCESSATVKPDDTVDRTRLYGIGYIAYEWEAFNSTESIYKQAIEMMGRMGIKSWRNWMHANWLLNDSSTVNEEACSLMHDILAEAAKYDIQVVGMSHNWFTGEKDQMSIPTRDLNEGSFYVKWLMNYEKSWETLAREFPEVTLWEIGNELNNDDFVHPFYWNTEGYTFTMSEKSKIAADMLYYGTRGVRRGNPEAKTIMGGITSPGDFYAGKNESFLTMLYENILSGEWPSIDPDDYFDYLAWHPYVGEVPNMKWVETNNALYDIACSFEGRKKKVFITEIGWPDTSGDGSNIGAYAEDVVERTEAMFKLIEEHMPYVEAVHTFRMFNDIGDTAWADYSVATYGLFNDPIYQDGLAKPVALKLQELAGGSGELNLLLNENPKPW